MAYTTLSATTPAVTPAAGEIVYDRFWITSVNIMSRSPQQPAMAIAQVVPARSVSGVTYIKPGDRGVTVQIEDLFTEADSNAALSGAIESLVQAVADIGREQGLIV